MPVYENPILSSEAKSILLTLFGQNLIAVLLYIGVHCLPYKTLFMNVIEQKDVFNFGIINPFFSNRSKSGYNCKFYSEI